MSPGGEARDLGGCVRRTAARWAVVLADYGLQRTWLMRAAFRVVQFVDGRADTQPNADGILPELIAAAGFSAVREVHVVPTVTGSISVLTAYREGPGGPRVE
ncbi:MAG TPA: hypothetical protein VG497_02580 [Kribbella sp.]|nr:hypothetical protein [Kribbella sp.]